VVDRLIVGDLSIELSTLIAKMSDPTFSKLSIDISI